MGLWLLSALLLFPAAAQETEEGAPVPMEEAAPEENLAQPQAGSVESAPPEEEVQPETKPVSGEFYSADELSGGQKVSPKPIFIGGRPAPKAAKKVKAAVKSRRGAVKKRANAKPAAPPAKAKAPAAAETSKPALPAASPVPLTPIVPYNP